MFARKVVAATMVGRMLREGGGGKSARYLSASTREKMIFYDMKHSNNAARVRLWLRHKEESGIRISDHVETRTVRYPDLQTPEFRKVNYLGKVPALLRPDGSTVFESAVILDYLERKFKDVGTTRFVPESCEERQLMDLIIRCHDLYVASPNCSMPGFAHSQGAMYLGPRENEFVSAERAMADRSVRAKKIAELWRQLKWLDDNLMAERTYLVSDETPTLADFTWYPTTIFMEFILPRVFGWPETLFRDDGGHGPVPNVARWWSNLTDTSSVFAGVRDEILEHWEEMWEKGQFDDIRDEVEDKNFQWSFPVNWKGPQAVMLEYQKPPPEGKLTGRYIGDADRSEDLYVDVTEPCKTVMHDGRELSPAATLDTHGFALANYPTAVQSFEDEDEDRVRDLYYEEMVELVKRESGATRVHVFDHTIRESGRTNLNAASAKDAAAPVPRVHCDYTAEGAPRRLEMLLGDADIVAGTRFAFINVWRSIDREHPVMQQPLAVADERSIPESDRFLYNLQFEDRRGENYSLRFSPEHKWYAYPKMTADECLLFKVYDRRDDGETPRFVFHTAFTDPRGGFRAPARKSVEARTIAFFD